MVLVTILGLVLISRFIDPQGTSQLTKTANVTFKNVYTSSSNSSKLAVVAGLAPLNATFLTFAPRDLLSLYTATYSMGFITDPKFVTSIPPLRCEGDGCMAIFLPGGLDAARRDDANNTLFDGTANGDFTAIVVDKAPGYHLEFETLDANYTFAHSDCVVYEESINDGLQICLKADGPRMLAGKNPTTPLDLQASDKVTHRMVHLLGANQAKECLLHRHILDERHGLGPPRQSLPTLRNRCLRSPQCLHPHD